MILLVNLCQEKLHYLEFVKPIEDILVKENISFFMKYYLDICKEDINKADKIIICGTSLKDNSFIKNISNFNWIRNCSKEILGVCAGMEVISLIFSGKLKEKTEIGYFKERFYTPFLGLTGEKEVYHLHNYYVSLPKDFISYCKSKIPQAIKHKSKEIYACLFHPEVRNKDLIINFSSKLDESKREL